MQNTEIIEIERRWIIPKMPPAEKILYKIRRDQSYPAGVRIVKKYCSDPQGTYNHYILSVKGPGTLARPEWEAEIPEWVYEQLLSQTDEVLDITRHFCKPLRLDLLHLGDGPEEYILEIDEYHGSLEGLIKVECEFYSEAEAGKFILPEWITNAIEVTDNPVFNNKNLVGKTYSDIKHFIE